MKMEISNCLNCGKPFPAKEGKLYCSRKCCRAFNRRRYDRTPVQCTYNEGVFCTEKTCERCGWNPSVARCRLGKIIRRLRNEVQKG